MSLSKIAAGGAEIVISAKDATSAVFSAIGNKISQFSGHMNKLGAFSSSLLTASGVALESIADGLNKVLVALIAGTGLAVGVGVKAASTISDIGDQFDKMSLRTGVAVESLSAFAFAANMSGTSIEAFETALNKTSKFMAALKDGSQGAKDNLKKLGLTMNDIQGKSPDQVMLLIGDALSKVGDNATRTSLTMEILGKSANELMPLFLSGAGGMAQMSDEAQRLGAVVSRSQADIGAGMNDAFGRMGAASQGVFMKIGEAIGPMLIGVVNKAAFAFAELGPKLATIAQSMLSIFVATANSLGGLWDFVKITALDSLGALVEAAPGLAFDLYAGWKIAVSKLAELFLFVTSKIQIAMEQLVTGEILKKVQGDLADMLIDAQALVGILTDAEAADIKQTRREDTERSIMSDPAMAESRKRQEQIQADMKEGLKAIGEQLTTDLNAVDAQEQAFNAERERARNTEFSLGGLTDAIAAMSDAVMADVVTADNTSVVPEVLERGTAEARRAGEANKKASDAVVIAVNEVKEAVVTLTETVAQTFQFAPA